MAEKKEGEEAEAPPKKKVNLLVVGFAVQIVAMGACLGLIVKNTLLAKKPVVSESHLRERRIASVRDDDTKVQVLDLQEFTTNLPNNHKLYAKIVIEISHEGVAEALNKRMPAVKAGLLRQLGGQNSSQLATVRGKLELKDLLRANLNNELLEQGVSSGIVREVYFTELILR